MLPAWVEPLTGNHGIRNSAIGRPIATPITPMTSICTNGRLRTHSSGWLALTRHCAGQCYAFCTTNGAVTAGRGGPTATDAESGGYDCVNRCKATLEGCMLVGGGLTDVVL